MHKPTEPLPCKYCGKIFRNFDYHKRHELWHQTGQTYDCLTCKKGFRHPMTLKAHLDVHSGKKPYECQICHQCFLRPFTLQCHMRIHTGEKPYPCKICGQRFRQVGDRNQHERRHNGQNKPRERKQKGLVESQQNDDLKLETGNEQDEYMPVHEDLSANTSFYNHRQFDSGNEFVNYEIVQATDYLLGE